MIAAKILGYYWIDGKLNPDDIASKHWAYLQIWQLLKPLLFYSGDHKKEKAKTDEWHKNSNNSTNSFSFPLVVSALEKSTSVDAFRVFYHQIPTNIDKDMIFYAYIIQTQLHQGNFVVIRIAITQQRLVQFPPPDRRCKNSDYGDSIRFFERLDPEDIGRDMAFLVSIIAILLRKFFFPSTQHAWKSS
jgi:hypothetical protein